MKPFIIIWSLLILTLASCENWRHYEQFDENVYKLYLYGHEWYGSNCELNTATGQVWLLDSKSKKIVNDSILIKNTEPQKYDRFSLHYSFSGIGNIYLLDKETGKVWLINERNSTLVPLDK